MTPEDLLISLLARERAIFRPLRQLDWSREGIPAARWELQREYRDLGLRYSEGGIAAERKAAQRALDEMIDVGVIFATASRGRRTHLRLTPTGRNIAEAISGAPTLHESFFSLRVLLDYGAPGTVVSELVLANLETYTAEYEKELFKVQQAILPAIVAGWVDAKSDVLGRAYYIATQQGKKARQPEPVDFRYTEESNRFFWEAYNAERERLLTVRPSRENEIGPIPMSCSPGDDVIGPWNRPTRKQSPKKPARKSRKGAK